MSASPPKADSRSLMNFSFAAVTSQSAGTGLAVAVAADPVIAELTLRFAVLETVEATCVCDARLDSSKVAKNLFASEPSLSAQGTGGIGGKSIFPVGSTIASGIILSGSRARKTLFIPPSSPL
jgi:hypothetical protein